MQPGVSMKWALALVVFLGCAPTQWGLRQEAITRLEMCVNSSLEPYAARQSCLADSLTYCTKVGISCNAEQIWQAAQFNISMEAPP